MVNLLLAWATFTGLAVFVLYVRDPQALGRHRSHLGAIKRLAARHWHSLCDSLRSRGWCPLRP